MCSLKKAYGNNLYMCCEKKENAGKGCVCVCTTNWHLSRSLPMTEQRHMPSASTETEPHAAIADDLQQPLREFRVERGMLQGIWWDSSLDSWMFLGTDFMISILVSPHI